MYFLRIISALLLASGVAAFAPAASRASKTSLSVYSDTATGIDRAYERYAGVNPADTTNRYKIYHDSVGANRGLYNNYWNGYDNRNYYGRDWDRRGYNYDYDRRSGYGPYSTGYRNNRNYYQGSTDFHVGGLNRNRYALEDDLSRSNRYRNNYRRNSYPYYNYNNGYYGGYDQYSPYYSQNGYYSGRGYRNDYNRGYYNDYNRGSYSDGYNRGYNRYNRGWDDRRYRNSDRYYPDSSYSYSNSYGNPNRQLYLQPNGYGYGSSRGFYGTSGRDWWN